MFNLDNPYRVYILVQLVVVLSVVMLFKFVPEKQIAALIASFLFIVSALAILRSEIKKGLVWQRASLWGVSLFLVCSALPIFFLRVLNWGADFSTLKFVGLSGGQLHQASSYFFILMLIAFFVDASIYRIKTKSRE